jgi:hypothetical protein
MRTMTSRRAVIHNRRFYWQYDDGRRAPIPVTEKLLSQMRQSQQAQVQARAAQRAMEEADAPPRRTNHPPRPPGTAPTLPAADRDIGDKTLGELAFDHGYGSVYRFSEALRKHRRAIYDAARANGRERANANLMTPPPGTAR